jgi:hypothetical protein
VPRPRRDDARWSDLAAAWAVATAVSGAPSTAWALATGGDPWEATRAAGAMLAPASAALPTLLAAAALAHVTISAFWAALLVPVLPARHAVLAATSAAAAIGVLDLFVIAPRAFPEVAALAPGPQLADHLAWGASLGATVAWRRRRRRRR